MSSQPTYKELIVQSKSIKERNAQITKQVAMKDYIDYYEVRLLAPP